MKTASDMALPLIGVGLMYRKGYFRQTIDADGHQEHAYPDYELARLPIRRALDRLGEPLTVSVPLPGRELFAAVWVVQVGRVPVLLLDTDVPDNDDSDRPITHILYVRGREMRLHQELVLGVGGVRALRELDLAPAVWHLNEGHSAFLLAERARELVATGLPLDDAFDDVRRNSVFTIHTPVAAGNERFDADLVRRVAGPLLDGDGRPNTGGVPVERLLALGLGVENDASQFDMTALCLRMTHGANAVSLLHGHTANATWHGISPHEILGLTNGVHTPTWVGQPMRDILERYTNADLETMDDQPASRRFWDRLAKVPADELWESHQRQKLELAIFARGRLRSQFARHGEAPSTLEELEAVLDPSILTIGFARRFATYKRSALLFTDLDRLARLLWDEERPMQVIFAGKAHPADRPGQGVIQDIFGRSRSPKLRGRVFILEDYDIRIARFLVQGVDVWLNNPRRPLEASGTSGMKAAANGVVNVSVLDGWWDEGWTGDNGWAIGGRETSHDEGAQDWSDAQDLYRILEDELIPAYYERDAERPARPLDAAHAQLDRQHDLAVLDDPDAPRVRRAAVPPGGRHRRRSHARISPRRRVEALRRRPSMAPRISLALAIHNHQPVGNFGWVFDEVYGQAYLPMLEALERHPGVRLSLHYTGPLLEWLRGRATGLPRAAARPRRRGTRSRSSAAACTSRSSRRSPSATGSTS